MIDLSQENFFLISSDQFSALALISADTQGASGHGYADFGHSSPNMLASVPDARQEISHRARWKTGVFCSQHYRGSAAGRG